MASSGKTLTILLVAAIALPTQAFEQSYRYDLLDGKQHEVCRHMLGVYNTSFTKPWSKEHLQGRTAGMELWQTHFSRYPTSPEFDSVRWKVHPYTVNKASNFALYAEFDIDNDGNKELVLKLGLFRGSPGSRDHIYVFPRGTINFDSFRDHEDFLRQFIEKRVTVWDYPVHQRPFIYRDRTYIHGYVFTARTFPGANPEEPFAPPEYITVSEYKGPAKEDSARRLPKRGAILKQVCKFEMIQER